METIKIETPMIQLDQFLKWASILQRGGDIRFLLDEDKILVNGILCKAKRKKLYPGDTVEIKDVGTYLIKGE